MHPGWVQWIKAQWARSPATQPIQSLLMEPIVVKDTLFFIQIIAACCLSNCMQAKQTPVCYLCRTANRMMVVLVVIAVVVAHTGALMTKQPHPLYFTENRRSCWERSEPCSDLQSFILFYSIQLSSFMFLCSMWPHLWQRFSWYRCIRPADTGR